jgi:hypothetical protein
MATGVETLLPQTTMTHITHIVTGLLSERSACKRVLLAAS